MHGAGSGAGALERKCRVRGEGGAVGGGRLRWVPAAWRRLVGARVPRPEMVRGWEAGPANSLLRRTLPISLVVRM